MIYDFFMMSDKENNFSIKLETKLKVYWFISLSIVFVMVGAMFLLPHIKNVSMLPDEMDFDDFEIEYYFIDDDNNEIVVKQNT